jgi:methylmalonyl-CoA/ethylmalonyl-CoA epimerase
MASSSETILRHTGAAQKRVSGHLLLAKPPLIGNVVYSDGKLGGAIMKVEKISHIGVAVNSIEEYIGFFRDVLGLELTGTEEVADQKVKVAFLTIGESRFELIEPTADDSPVRKYLDKNDGKPRIHHVACQVDDLDAALEEVREKGVRLIDEEPRIGAGGVRIAFLHPKATAGVLTELCEQH